jgi:hypothetical protein
VGVRGGVQVLPPLLPPRTKPKPPLPPKRDELTRLTTVKKDPIPLQRNHEEDRRDDETSDGKNLTDDVKVTEVQRKNGAENKVPSHSEIERKPSLEQKAPPVVPRSALDKVELKRVEQVPEPTRPPDRVKPEFERKPSQSESFAEEIQVTAVRLAQRRDSAGNGQISKKGSESKQSSPDLMTTSQQDESTPGDELSKTEEPVPEEHMTVESRIHFIENLERQNSFRKTNGVSRPDQDSQESDSGLDGKESPPQQYEYYHIDYKESVECVYATINPDTKRSAVKPPEPAERNHIVEKPPPEPPAESVPEKQNSEEKDEDTDSEEGATADIWVRAIDSPVKKPPKEFNTKMFRSVSTSEEREDKFPIAHRASFDNSHLRSSPKSETKPQIIIENKEFEPVQDSSQLSDKRLGKLGCESLPCSRPSSRATSRSSSPAFFGDKSDKQSSKPRISAAEALGVVAKPCPRPPPGNRVKNSLEFRRQSLNNLSDSKLSMNTASSTSQQLWSSFGECQEYRRHERQRGQSADSRTLQRLRSADVAPAWDNYSSTLSRIGKYAKVQERGGADRPKSTCNCGQHVGHPVPPPPPQNREVGKRTFSVEELTTGRACPAEFVRGTSRSSLGKSPRVTFALSEDEMGATGGGDPPRKPVRASRPPVDPSDDRYYQQVCPFRPSH